MNDYKELIELLAHPIDGRDSADIMIAAADAIEQIVAEYNELDNAHDKLFIEYHKVKKQRDAAIAWLPRVCGYCKQTAPRSVRDLQRWCNNRFLYRSCKLEDYVPRKDGKTFKELYMRKEQE